MRIFPLIFTAFLALSPLPWAAAGPAQAAPATTARVYGAEVAYLRNGLTLVVIPNHRIPAVTHMIWYKAGAADEPWGTSGLAHFLEHLMFKGTPTVGDGAFSAIIQRMGGSDNAFTSWDYTAFFQSVPRDHLQDVMAMEADRMNNLTPAFPTILSEKQVVIEERRQTTESEPSAILNEQMSQALFINHPYGRPIIGWMPEMQSLKWVNALQFYKARYAPNNAVVVIAGDVTLAEARSMAEATYGKLKPEVVPKRPRYASPPLKASVRLTYAHSSVRQPAWMRMVRVPSARLNPKTALTLMVLDDVLGGTTGRLYQDLVVKHKLASSIDTSYNPYAIDETRFALYATPADGVSLPELEAGIDVALNDILKQPITDTEVKASVARLQDQAVYARDSLSGPAMTIGYALLTGTSLDFAETWPSALATVSAQQVTAAFEHLVMGVPTVTGLLTPQRDKP